VVAESASQVEGHVFLSPCTGLRPDRIPNNSVSLLHNHEFTRTLLNLFCLATFTGNTATSNGMSISKCFAAAHLVSFGILQAGLYLSGGILHSAASLPFFDWPAPQARLPRSGQQIRA